MFHSRRVLVATTIVSMLGFTTAPAVAAADATFRCDPGFYQVISGQLAEFDPGAGTYDTIGVDHDNFNAMGYRIADGYMYAVGNSSLYRIDADGARTQIASGPDVPGGYTGDFGDDGLLHVSSGGRNWHTIDVDTLEFVSVPELSSNMSVADIANVNGVFYGVSSSGSLMRIDPAALTAVNVGQVDGLPSTSMSYGAAWATAGGNLYVGRNSGEIFQITGYSTDAPVATQVGTAPATNSNDGSSCSLAPPPAGLADVDGPESETEPSTPAAREAAERYEEAGPLPAEPSTTEPAEEPEPEPSSETYNVPDAGIGQGASCAATVDVDRPQRDGLGILTVVEQPTVLFDSSFDSDSLSAFQILSGSWTAADGDMSQITSCDFDATALLRGFTVDHFRWEISLRADAGRNHGGVLINQSSPLTRSGATLIDLADGGAVVRWGTYDDAGYYQFGGSAPIVQPVDGSLVDIAVEVHGADVSIEVGGNPIADIQVARVGGLVGLVATQSKAAFAAATLTALPANIEVG